jgi:hypothetical protein
LINSGINEVIAYQTAFIVAATITSIGFIIFLFLTLLIHIRKNN